MKWVFIVVSAVAVLLAIVAQITLPKSGSGDAAHLPHGYFKGNMPNRYYWDYFLAVWLFFE